MGDVVPCEDCACGLADEPVEDAETVETVDLSTALDFSVLVRDYLERYDLVDEDDRVLRVEVCPERVRAHIDRSG